MTADPQPPSARSAVDVAPSDRWYLPGLGERLRLMGWRNLLWLPPLAMIVLLGVTIASNIFAVGQMFVWWKLIAIVVALPIAAATRASARALSTRDDLFCIHCGYSLVGLPAGEIICPECGATVNGTDSIDYRRDPHWFIQRRKQSHPRDSAPFEAGANRVDNPDGL